MSEQMIQSGSYEEYLQCAAQLSEMAASADTELEEQQRLIDQLKQRKDRVTEQRDGLVDGFLSSLVTSNPLYRSAFEIALAHRDIKSMSIDDSLLKVTHSFAQSILAAEAYLDSQTETTFAVRYQESPIILVSNPWYLSQPRVSELSHEKVIGIRAAIMMLQPGVNFDVVHNDRTYHPHRGLARTASRIELPYILSRAISSSTIGMDNVVMLDRPNIVHGSEDERREIITAGGSNVVPRLEYQPGAGGIHKNEALYIGKRAISGLTEDLEKKHSDSGYDQATLSAALDGIAQLAL